MTFITLGLSHLLHHLLEAVEGAGLRVHVVLMYLISRDEELLLCSELDDLADIVLGQHLR